MSIAAAVKMPAPAAAPPSPSAAPMPTPSTPVPTPAPTAPPTSAPTSAPKPPAAPPNLADLRYGSDDRTEGISPNAQMRDKAELNLASPKTDVKFTNMPWKTQLEIAAGSVAGAAALGGAIAGIVVSQTTAEPRQVRAAPKAKIQHTADVPVSTPPPAAVAASALYDDPPAALMVDNAFIAAACCLLIIGCLFLSVSIFAYYRSCRSKRGTEIRTAETSSEEVSESEEESLA